MIALQPPRLMKHLLPFRLRLDQHLQPLKVDKAAIAGLAAFLFHLFSRLQDADLLARIDQHLFSICRQTESGNAGTQRLDLELLEIVSFERSLQWGQIEYRFVRQRALYRNEVQITFFFRPAMAP